MMMETSLSCSTSSIFHHSSLPSLMDSAHSSPFLGRFGSRIGSRRSSLSSWMSRVSLKHFQGPWRRTTKKQATSDILHNVTGVILGFLRFGYFLAAFTVITLHLKFPPVGLTASSAGGYSWENYVAGTLEYMRFAFEVTASLIIVGDAVVTWSTLNGALSSSSTFMAQIDLSPWFARSLLIMVVCSSYSTPAETFIEKTWSKELAMVYLNIPFVTLVSGIIMVLVTNLPGFSDHAWLNYDRKSKKPQADAWTPDIEAEERREGELFETKQASSRTVKAICLVPPITALCLHISALIFTSPSTIHRDTENLASWRATMDKCLQIILCLVLILFIIVRIVKKSNDKIPLPVKACLIYVVINALTLVHLLTELVWVVVPLYTAGLFAIVIPVFAFTLTTSAEAKKKRVTHKIAWIAGFLKNFRHIGKWLRLSEVIAVVVSLCGLVLAGLALPLPWFKIHFEPDPELEDFMETMRKFNQSLNEVTLELAHFIEIAEKQFKDITCEQMAAAAAGAAVAVIIPGVGQATKQVLRIARYMRNFARSALRYKSHFYKLGATMRKVKGVVNDVKKPLLVGISLENMGMLMFLLPVILTGIIVIFFAFWPRKLRSGNQMMGRKKSCLVLGTAILHLIFNLAGLLLFEWWGPMLAVIADGLPLTTAELIKERGWVFVESCYSCAVVASTIFLIQAVFSIFRPDEDPNPVGLTLSKDTRRHLPSSVLDSEESLQMRLRIPDRDTRRKRNMSTRTQTKMQKLKESLNRMKMFRDSMMDTAPPRAWALSITITIIAVGLSIKALMEEWITFDPVLKPKWARLIGQFDSESNSSKLLQEDIENDTKDCIFDINLNLKDLLPTIISPEFIQLWKDLTSMLRFPVFNLFDFDINFRIIAPLLLKFAITIPNFICCGLVITGFITSFSVRASYYFPTHEVMSWISKISLYVIFAIFNTIVFIRKLFAGTEVPFYNLNIEIHPGFYLSSAASVLILIVWILLIVETMAPPMYVRRTEQEPEVFESRERIPVEEIKE